MNFLLGICVWITVRWHQWIGVINNHCQVYRDTKPLWLCISVNLTMVIYALSIINVSNLSIRRIHLIVLSLLKWRHTGLDDVSIHQPRDCLLSRLFGRRSKKASKLRVTGLCVGNLQGTGEFAAQMASNAENVSIWWRHHDTYGVNGSTNVNIKKNMTRAIEIVHTGTIWMEAPKLPGTAYRWNTIHILQFQFCWLGNMNYSKGPCLNHLFVTPKCVI